jgi:hypothetical protein
MNVEAESVSVSCCAHGRLFCTHTHNMAAGISCSVHNSKESFHRTEKATSRSDRRTGEGQLYRGRMLCSCATGARGAFRFGVTWTRQPSLRSRFLAARAAEMAYRCQSVEVEDIKPSLASNDAGRMLLDWTLCDATKRTDSAATDRPTDCTCCTYTTRYAGQLVCALHFEVACAAE